MNFIGNTNIIGIYYQAFWNIKRNKQKRNKKNTWDGIKSLTRLENIISSVLQQQKRITIFTILITSLYIFFLWLKLQNTEAASQRASKKRCFENMQQIYRRTPMSKCDFNKVALLCNFVKIALRHVYFPVNLLHIFRTPFLKNTSGWLLLKT